MTADPFVAARAVADAVLYEGYVLYPYRASARKNQLRWQFGVLVPPAVAAADGSERCVDPDRGAARTPRAPPGLGPDPVSAGAAPRRRGATPVATSSRPTR